MEDNRSIMSNKNQGIPKRKTPLIQKGKDAQKLTAIAADLVYFVEMTKAIRQRLSNEKRLTEKMAFKFQIEIKLVANVLDNAHRDEAKFQEELYNVMEKNFPSKSILITDNLQLEMSKLKFSSKLVKGK